MGSRALVVGGVCWCELVHLRELPGPRTLHLRALGRHATVGHMGAGKALNLARLGFETTLHAFLGDDEDGRRVRERLQAGDVHLACDLDPAGTETHLNLMDDAGGRISITLNAASFDPPLDLPRLGALAAAHDHVAVNVVNYTRHLLPLLRAQGKAIWCDLGDYDPGNPYHEDFLAAADYLTLSSSCVPDHRALLQQLVGRGKRLVVATHGAGGATALSASGEWVEQPIVAAYPLVDANGAGDSFFAGLLYAHTRGHDLRRSLQLATVVAGLTISCRELANPALSPELAEREWAEHFGPAPGAAPETPPC